MPQIQTWDIPADDYSAARVIRLESKGLTRLVYVLKKESGPVYARWAVWKSHDRQCIERGELAVMRQRICLPAHGTGSSATTVQSSTPRAGLSPEIRSSPMSDPEKVPWYLAVQLTAHSALLASQLVMRQASKDSSALQTHSNIDPVLERIVCVSDVRGYSIQIILEVKPIRIPGLPVQGLFMKHACNPRASALDPSGLAHTTTADCRLSTISARASAPPPIINVILGLLH
ncbi:uncharacterized protein P174DRAFT_415736 [Aspergillus novofumigatus IBT 16806]|uniref:Uncharacterized protein n=1 Tax=Aspergillus novofumigatus (strain IBT 16806) TaxID=1392255 RepID=A0A2I1CK06_ASPN1|nr:uncharacterized protein P174DRAFT_415736 [Aspergillus novofumigatus IBT 16806]PKX97952.1 hypothetical protein P174DRAFT_415736 [Aspergillus novofumigatus IBT 16806]